jgi:hypothetical protein
VKRGRFSGGPAAPGPGPADVPTINVTEVTRFVAQGAGKVVWEVIGRSKVKGKPVVTIRRETTGQEHTVDVPTLAKMIAKAL